MALSVPEVKRWKPRHDHIVLMHLAGRSNKEIATALGLKEPRVSTIINTRRGQAAILRLRKQMLERVPMAIEEQLMSLGQRAVENVADTINADVAPMSRAKKHQDGVSFELLSRIGFGRKDRDDRDVTGITLHRDIQERLVAAIEKSAEATRIYEADSVEVEVEPPRRLAAK